MKKPKWVIEKEQARRGAARETVWLFGLHAVRDALANPRREKLRLIVTRNALERLGEAAVLASGLAPEIADARAFPAPLEPDSVHQGAALEAKPLDWGRLDAIAPAAGLLVLLDQVTDPHNVGAVLRSAEVFGAGAVVAPSRHAAPESGALAKAASGALERQPYLRIGNLGDGMEKLAAMGYALVGLDGAAEAELAPVLAGLAGAPLALVLGAEGPGLRDRTRALCTTLARIGGSGGFGSLNVSNAAAVALYAARQARAG